MARHSLHGFELTCPLPAVTGVMLPWIAALASGSVADSNRQARPIEAIKPIWSDDHLFLLFHVINIHWAA